VTDACPRLLKVTPLPIRVEDVLVQEVTVPVQKYTMPFGKVPVFEVTVAVNVMLGCAEVCVVVLAASVVVVISCAITTVVLFVLDA
jgi:hypothetical protein